MIRTGRKICLKASALALPAILLVAACTTTPPPSAVSVAKQEAKLPPAERDIEKQSAALTMDGYKRDVARQIYLHHADWLYDGKPPPALASIVVLSIKIDARGNPLVSVLRSNGYTEFEERAVASVRTAAPLPIPSRVVMRNNVAEFTETWLFRSDGRFQIRSIAEAQASTDD